MAIKECRICKAPKELGSFCKDCTQTDNYGRVCADCRRTPEYRAQHAKQRREHYAKHGLEIRCKAFGITVEEYNILFEKQGRKCAVCNTDKPGGRHNTWHIDHDHESGKVRGVLCAGCNMILGFVERNLSTRISKMLIYLERTK